MQTVIHSNLFESSDFIVANFSMKLPSTPGVPVPFFSKEELVPVALPLLDTDGSAMDVTLAPVAHVDVTSKMISDFDESPEEMLPIFSGAILPVYLDQKDMEYSTNRYFQCTLVLLEALDEIHGASTFKIFSIVPTGYDTVNDPDDLLDDLSFAVCTSATKKTEDSPTVDIRMSVVVNSRLPIEYGENMRLQGEEYTGVVNIDAHFRNLLLMVAPFLNNQTELLEKIELDNVLVAVSTTYSDMDTTAADELLKTEQEDGFDFLLSPYNKKIGAFVIHVDNEDDVACCLLPYDELHEHALEDEDTDILEEEDVDLGELSFDATMDHFQQAFKFDT